MTSLKHLNEGDVIFIQGSGKKPYEVKKVGGIVSCSCPAWRNLGGSIDTRVCKHIKANIDPKCLLPQAISTAKVQAVKAAGPRLTKTGKISTAVGGAVMKDTAPPVLLAHKWEDEDISGWWMSEKLDGVRAWWDGTNFISRLGNIYHAPEWFKAEFPDFVLDGELWIGRGKFQQTISTVRKLIPNDQEWKSIKFMVFDGGWWSGDNPAEAGPFEKRQAWLKSEVEDHLDNCGGLAVLVEQVKCENVADLKLFLKDKETQGAEGVMLREPKSLYEEGRSKTLLKVKTFFDAEAKVIGHEPGRGKHKGRLGALLCEAWKGKEFKVGSGFTDQERKNPPKVGSTITYRYQELSKDGIPRFPTYVCERNYE